MKAACHFTNIVIIETVSQLKKESNSKRQMKNNYHLDQEAGAKCIQLQNRFYPITKCA